MDGDGTEQGQGTGNDGGSSGFPGIPSASSGGRGGENAARQTLDDAVDSTVGRKSPIDLQADLLRKYDVPSPQGAAQNRVEAVKLLEDAGFVARQAASTFDAVQTIRVEDYYRAPDKIFLAVAEALTVVPPLEKTYDRAKAFIDERVKGRIPDVLANRLQENEQSLQKMRERIIGAATAYRQTNVQARKDFQVCSNEYRVNEEERRALRTQMDTLDADLSQAEQTANIALIDRIRTIRDEKARQYEDLKDTAYGLRTISKTTMVKARVSGHYVNAMSALGEKFQEHLSGTRELVQHLRAVQTLRGGMSELRKYDFEGLQLISADASKFSAAALQDFDAQFRELEQAPPAYEAKVDGILQGISVRASDQMSRYDAEMEKMRQEFAKVA